MLPMNVFRYILSMMTYLVHQGIVFPGFTAAAAASYASTASTSTACSFLSLRWLFVVGRERHHRALLALAVPSPRPAGRAPRRGSTDGHQEVTRVDLLAHLAPAPAVVPEVAPAEI